MATLPTQSFNLADLFRQIPPGYTITVTMSGAGTAASFTPTYDHPNKTLTLALST